MRPLLERPIKSAGNRTFVEEVLAIGRDRTPILAGEVDADFRTIYDAWNDPASSFAPGGPATGAFAGSDWSNPVLAPASVPRAALAPDIPFLPSMTPADIGSVLTVATDQGVLTPVWKAGAGGGGGGVKQVVSQETASDLALDATARILGSHDLGTLPTEPFTIILSGNFGLGIVNSVANNVGLQFDIYYMLFGVKYPLVPLAMLTMYAPASVSTSVMMPLGMIRQIDPAAATDSFVYLYAQKQLGTGVTVTTRAGYFHLAIL